MERWIIRPPPRKSCAPLPWHDGGRARPDRKDRSEYSTRFAGDYEPSRRRNLPDERKQLSLTLADQRVSYGWQVTRRLPTVARDELKLSARKGPFPTETAQRSARSSEHNRQFTQPPLSMFRFSAGRPSIAAADTRSARRSSSAACLGDVSPAPARSIGTRSQHAAASHS